MSSRATILDKIKANKPEVLPLPSIQSDLFDENLERLAHFKKMVEAVGGNVIEGISYDTIHDQTEKIYPNCTAKYSTSKNSGDFNSVDLETIQKPQDLEHLDLLLLEGEFGVVENGAVWLSHDDLPIRVLPFITKHLVLLLDQSKLVSNMHTAYQQLNDQNFDYGLFLSGPSKTADIEQSLVIGAQGAMSLTVILYDR
jgi:L-lactate dehydrogenase complex protein LldG